MNSKEMTQKVADEIVSDITNAYNYELAHGFREDAEDDDGWSPYEDEETLSYYVYDNLGVRFVINERLEYESAIITLAWGGPNIYFHTDTGRVEVFWEGRAIAYVDPLINSMIDDMMADYFSHCRY